MKNSQSITKAPALSLSFFVLIVLSVIGYASQILLTGWISLFRAVLDIILVSVLLVFLIRIFRRSRRPFREELFRYFFLLSAISGFFSLILWVGAFVSNTFPGALSKITLSNGEKTIIYYQMSHIASKKYYTTIASELSSYATGGYSFYLEGVLPGTPENQDRLEKAIGMKMSSGTYSDIASIMGLSSQDASLFDGIPPESLIHADLSVDDIANALSTTSVRSDTPVDISRELESLSGSLGNRRAIEYLFRAILNASLRYSVSSDGLFDFFDPATVDALLKKRNQAVVDTYIEKNTTNSVFIYGALHFDGIFALLKSKDPRWEIQSLDPIYPYVP